MHVKLTSAGVAATVAMGLAASSALASTTIGQVPPTDGSLEPCLAGVRLQLSVLNGPDYVVPPGGGVITAWKSSLSGPVGLSVFRGSGTTFTRISEDNVTGTGALMSFNVRTPVLGGDRIGMRAPATTPRCLDNTGFAPDQIGFSTTAAIGTPTPFTPVGGYRINLEAVVEADADGDGFGDETQDGCPTDAAVHGPCPDRVAPETTVTKAPKSKIKTRTRNFVRIKLEFDSSELGSSFSCKLDGTAAGPCASPFKARVGKGKHRFSVAATDSAGNADVTPAQVRFQVKQKHFH